MPRRVAFFLGVLAVASLFAAWTVRAQLGIELSTHGIREQVEAMGWKAPALYLALLTFRQFLFLPAIVILPVGGLCFGATVGTVLGATGIVLSALITFAIARGIGGRWLHELFGPRYAWLERRIRDAGAPVVGIVTAHPTGPMGAFFWGAGFSSMALLPFAIAVAAGGSVRAMAYAFFGSTLLTPGSPRFYVACALLAAAVILPLAHPGVRRKVLGPPARERRQEPSSSIERGQSSRSSLESARSASSRPSFWQTAQ
ncbi:MAG TPA: VTT domain-containing protein [Candidatus Binatia bacterium]